MKKTSARRTLTMALAAGLTMAGIAGLTGCQNNTQAGNSGSSSSEGDSLSRVSAIAEKSSRGQFKATKLFDGPADSGMQGVILEGPQGGNKMVAWTDKKGNYLMPGPLFNKDGENLSEKFLNEQAGYVTPAKLAEKVTSEGFMAGTKGPVLTIFFEPYCGYCNALFEKMKPMVESGKIQARIIMVGFLRPDSVPRAANIQFDPNPWKALTTWEGIKDKSKAKTAEAPSDQISKIQELNNLMNSAGQTGTPAILYCNKATKQVEMSKGMPPNFEEFVNTVGEDGSAACKK